VAEVVVKANWEVLVNVFEVRNNLNTNVIDLVLHVLVEVQPGIHIQGVEINEVLEDVEDEAVLALLSCALVVSGPHFHAQFLHLKVPESVNSIQRIAT